MSALERVDSAAPGRWTPEQVALIKEQIAPDTTDDELALFGEVCRRTGLDPFRREIYAIVRNDKKAKRGKRMTIQVSIDGLRIAAESSGIYAGQTAPQWCGPDMVWRDLWLSDEPPVGARVGVYRVGHPAPTYGVVTWAEFAQVYPDGNPKELWKAKPAHMLAKVAEAAALRKACPRTTSGIYTDDELGPDVPPPSPRSAVPHLREPDPPQQPLRHAFAAARANLSGDDLARLAALATELGIGTSARAMITEYGDELRDLPRLLERMERDVLDRDARLAQGVGDDPQAAEDSAAEDSGSGAMPAGGTAEAAPPPRPTVATDAPQQPVEPSPDPEHAEAVARFQHGADHGFDDPEPVNPDQTSIFNPGDPATPPHRDPS